MPALVAPACKAAMVRWPKRPYTRWWDSQNTTSRTNKGLFLPGALVYGGSAESSAYVRPQYDLSVNAYETLVASCLLLKAAAICVEPYLQSTGKSTQQTMPLKSCRWYLQACNLAVWTAYQPFVLLPPPADAQSAPPCYAS